jgi:zinc protease
MGSFYRSKSRQNQIKKQISMTNLNRSITPDIKNPIHFNYHLPDCQKIILNNNIPLYYINLGAQEVVQIEWVFNAGLWQETKIGVAQTTASLLKNGTINKSAAVINEAIEQLGASLKISANNDFAIITLTTLTKHLGKLLPLIWEIINEPAFSDTELTIYKQNAIQKLKVNLLRSDFVSNRMIDALVFGKSHPYGSYTEQADIDALQREDLITFHQQHYTTANCKIFVSGKFEEKDLAQIQHYFGDKEWHSNIHPTLLAHTTTPNATMHHRIINDANSVQGAIRVASPFIDRRHPDFAPMLVLNTIFGGYFGSRLMSNIREEKGFTYGIYSQFFAYKNASAFLIATEAGKDVCEATVHEVLAEAKRLTEEPVSEDELLLVKNYILGNLLGDLDGAFNIMSRWKSLILNDLDRSHFDNNINVYKNITSDTIQELAAKYLNMDKFYNLIVY